MKVREDRVQFPAARLSQVLKYYSIPKFLRTLEYNNIWAKVNMNDYRGIIIEESFDCSRGGSWCADFKNDMHHYIIFRDKIFYVSRKNKDRYDEAKRYGISLGIPEYQVDFHPGIKEWER